MKLGYKRDRSDSKYSYWLLEEFFNNEYKISFSFDVDYVDETIHFSVMCEDLRDSSVIFEKIYVLLSEDNTLYNALEYSITFPFFKIRLVEDSSVEDEKRLVFGFYNDEGCKSLIDEREIVFSGNDYHFKHFKNIIRNVFIETLKGNMGFSEGVRRKKNKIEKERENRLKNGYNGNNKSCDMTFYSDNGDDVYVRLLNESTGDKKFPEIQICKRNKENDKYEKVRNYVVDETPDFRGVVELSEGGHTCVIPVKTPDGKKKYLSFESKFDVGNPSHLMLKIGEYKLYSFSYGSILDKDLFKVDCFTVYTSNRFLLTELAHFIEKYIIPNSETKYSINLDSVPKRKR